MGRLSGKPVTPLYLKTPCTDRNTRSTLLFERSRNILSVIPTTFLRRALQGGVNALPTYLPTLVVLEVGTERETGPNVVLVVAGE